MDQESPAYPAFPVDLPKAPPSIGCREQPMVSLKIAYDSRASFDFQQNDVPVIRRLQMLNLGEPLIEVRVRVTSEPEFGAAWDARI